MRSSVDSVGQLIIVPITQEEADGGGDRSAFRDVAHGPRAGSRHLRILLDEFKDVRLSLAAYNAGETPVRRLGRIPPYRETQSYVRKVMAIYQVGSKISITKGGRIYSMSLGGTPRVRSAPVTGKKSSSGAAARPAEAPEKAGGDSHQARTTQGPETATMPSQEASSFEKTGSRDGTLYYRYTDSNGVIYITREKPPHPFYEVLQP